MIKTSKVVKNAAWIIICRIIQSLLSLVVGMFTARYLGPSNYGLINYVASLVAFVAPITYLGLNSILVQEVINNPDNEGEILGTAIFMSSISSVLCIIGVTAFVYIANPGETETLVVCFLYSIMLFFQAIDLLQYWFQAKLLSKYTSIVMLFAYCMVSSYKIFLLATHKSIVWFSISNVIDYFIIAVCLVAIYSKVGTTKLSVSLKRIPIFLNRSKYYIVSNLMVVVFTQTDKIMLKVMLDDSATGYYSAAVTCAGITAFVFAAIIDSFRPSIFESKKYSYGAFENNVIRLYAVIIWISLAQSLGMSVLAKPIISILYGRDFMPTVGLLRIVVWYSTFAYLGSVRGVWMLAEEKQKYLLNINITGALSNVILNYFLIPQYGASGAAIASFITQFFTNVILGYIIKDMRANNRLMVKGLNPKVLMGVISKIKQ